LPSTRLDKMVPVSTGCCPGSLVFFQQTAV
jgi:hypothetical protein